MNKRNTAFHSLAAPAFLTGGGVMGGLIRAHDWSTSPLGRPDSWPQSLRSIVGLILQSKFPMFIAWGPELSIFYNDSYVEILGDKHPAALGRRFHDVWEEIWEDIQPLVDRAMTGEATYHENLPLTMWRKGYAEPTWFTFSYSPLRNEIGDVAGVYCVCTETTGQVLNERSRVQQNERLQNLFVQAPGLMAVVREPNHRFELVNNAYLQLVGHRNLVGKTVRDALPELEGQGFYELLDQVYTSGQAYVGYSVPVKLQRHPGGELEERFVDFVFQPIKDITGEATEGIFVEGSDVTDRHYAKLELERLNLELADKVGRLEQAERHALDAAHQAESERHLLDALLEAAPVGIAMVDAAGKVIRVNRGNQNLWGEALPLSETIDEYAEWKGWWADGSDRQGRRLEPREWALARALRGEEAPRDIVEIEPFGAPGVRKTIVNCGAPVRDDNGEITGAVVAQIDITEHVKAEEKLREADRRKDEFLAMLAHELRNPLAPISAAAELIEMVPLNAKRLKQTSQVISRQVRHMTGLVDDLLDVSRVTRGLVNLNKIDLDVKHIISDAIEQVRPIIEGKRHHLTVELAPEPAHVLGDRKRLVQILTNLLHNAAKYTPEGGTIHLQMETPDGHVRLCVLDTGIGIAPELQPRIFELFAQAERPADRSQGGLGIGLALVKSLVELHEGHVVCHSEGVGKGSQFIVTLPRLLEHGTVTKERPDTRQLPKAAQKLRILVVDDNADAAQMLAMYLEAAGHQVLVEHGSKRALERARIDMPDVCILDIGLPELNGNELARRLRAQKETAEAILIAVTGYGQEQDKQNAMDAGFDHHFVKPVETAKLVALMSKMRGRKDR
jgi:signal transduction histidine kinase/CheY-like chemotaxis protein